MIRGFDVTVGIVCWWFISFIFGLAAGLISAVWICLLLCGLRFAYGFGVCIGFADLIYWFRLFCVVCCLLIWMICGFCWLCW